MDLKFKDRLAYYAFGQETLPIQSIAIQGMEEGFSTPSLVILAGLQSDETSFEVAHYFRQTLRELNMDLPTKSDAVFYLIKSFAEQIISGNLDTYDGCKFIFERVVNVTDLRDGDKYYVNDGISLNEVYGLYEMVCDLEYAANDWSSEKTNEQLMEETKNNIKSKLLMWLKKNGG